MVLNVIHFLKIENSKNETIYKACVIIEQETRKIKINGGFNILTTIPQRIT